MAAHLKTVVQTLNSSFYYRVGDVWTTALEHAFDFKDPKQALRFCEKRELDLNQVQVVKKSLRKTDEPRKSKGKAP